MLLFNDALCKSIAIFHLIDNAVCHIPLKSLVLTTHIVSMAWRVTINFSMWHNGTKSTIDRRCFLTSLYQSHDTFLLSTDILNTVRSHESENKRICYSWINRNINATFIQRWSVMLTLMLPLNYPYSIMISCMNPQKSPLLLLYNPL